MTLPIGTAGPNPSPAVVAALVRLEAEARARGGQTAYVRREGRPVGLLVILPDSVTKATPTPDR